MAATLRAQTPDWLREAITKGEIPPVLLFFGDEDWMKERAVQALRKALLPAGLEQMNEVTLRDCTSAQIIEAALTFPFMCDKRCVFVRDWNALLKGKKAKKDDDGAKGESADGKTFLDWVNEAPPTCALVLILSAGQGAQNLSKSATDAVNAGSITAVRFDRLYGAELTRWMQSHLKPLHKKLPPAAAALLTDMVGNDLTLLSMELEKLAAYSLDREEITEADVRAIVSPQQEYNIFRLTELLYRGKHAEGDALVNALLLNGERAAGIVSLMTGQLRRNYLVREGLTHNPSADAVARWADVTPKAMFPIQKNTSGLPVSVLEECFALCLETDYAIKSGKLREESALKTLLLKIATKCADASSKKLSSKKGG